MFLYDGKCNFMEEALMNLTHGNILIIPLQMALV